MAIRLSYGMFPWLTFKRVYTDFKNFTRSKIDDKTTLTVFEALVCPAEGSRGLLKHTFMPKNTAVHKSSPTSIHAEMTELAMWQLTDEQTDRQMAFQL